MTRQRPPGRAEEQGFPLRLASTIVVGGVLVGFLTGLDTGAASAQSTPDRSAELESKLDRALQVIEDLSARIRQLEAGAAARPASSPRVSESPPSAPPTVEGASVQPVPEPAPERGARLTPPEDHHTGLGLRIPGLGIPLRGFVDLGGGANNAKGKPQGFALGSLDFYLTPRFGDQAMGLAELVFEYDDKGELTVDLERLQLGYTFRDELTTWLGRFHTPLGYWNTAFHHGKYLMTSATRPEFLEFEDRRGILPVHTVGLWGTGRVPLGGGKVTYDAFVGNTPTIEDGVLNPLNIGRRNLNLMTGVNVGYSFRRSARRPSARCPLAAGRCARGSNRCRPGGDNDPQRLGRLPRLQQLPLGSAR